MLKGILIFIFALILTGCNTCQWLEATYSYSFDKVWNTAYKVVSKRYHISKASLEERTIETDWDVQVSIHYLDGYRNKVYLTIEEYKEPTYKKELDRPFELNEEVKKERYTVKVCVLREQNRNLDNPSVAGEADWYFSGNNSDEARKILSFIKSKLSLIVPEKTKEKKIKEKQEDEFAPKKKW